MKINVFGIRDPQLLLKTDKGEVKAFALKDCEIEVQDRKGENIGLHIYNVDTDEKTVSMVWNSKSISNEEMEDLYARFEKCSIKTYMLGTLLLENAKVASLIVNLKVKDEKILIFSSELTEEENIDLLTKNEHFSIIGENYHGDNVYLYM